jgi:hypothetical protein
MGFVLLVYICLSKLYSGRRIVSSRMEDVDVVADVLSFWHEIVRSSTVH